MRALAAAAGALASVALASPALAVEHEHHLGVDVGGSVLVIGDKSTSDVGGTAMVHYTYDLSDEFQLMLEGAYSLVALGQTADNGRTPHTYPEWVANADAGIGYVFDVLTWVPYVGVLVGGYGLSGGTIHGFKAMPGVEVALGLDYRISQSISVGVAGRQHFLSETDTYPSFTQVLGRFEFVWGR
jgi:Outer membrane protein beta-barrel domain